MNNCNKYSFINRGTTKWGLGPIPNPPSPIPNPQSPIYTNLHHLHILKNFKLALNFHPYNNLIILILFDYFLLLFITD